MCGHVGWPGRRRRISAIPRPTSSRARSPAATAGSVGTGAGGPGVARADTHRVRRPVGQSGDRGAGRRDRLLPCRGIWLRPRLPLHRVAGGAGHPRPVHGHLAVPRRDGHPRRRPRRGAAGRLGRLHLWRRVAGAALRVARVIGEAHPHPEVLTDVRILRSLHIEQVPPTPPQSTAEPLGDCRRTSPRETARARPRLRRRSQRTRPIRPPEEAAQPRPGAGALPSHWTGKLLPHRVRIRRRLAQAIRPRPHTTSPSHQRHDPPRGALSQLHLMLFAPTNYHGQSGCLIFPTLAAPVSVCLRCTARPPCQAAYARLRRLSRSPRSRGCPLPARLRFPSVAGFSRSASRRESGTGNPLTQEGKTR